MEVIIENLKYFTEIILANENGFIFLLAEFPFTNALKNSIQYFEVKMNDTGVFVNFGLENTSNEQISMLFTFGVDPFRSPYFKGDIFGCGLVISPNESQESSYVFFTKNGIKIAKGDVVMIEPLERFWPSIGLQSCSIESTNFGNDLVTKPFCYDISKHV
uniref:Uncharacterized protein n=1 Tax=Meloidogyne hapla TaxID=6305 RepID=A0A1I8B366_MELHA